LHIRHDLALAVLTTLVASLPAVSSATDRAPRFAGALQELDADHDRSLAAVRELSSGGEAAAVAVCDAWPSLTNRAQSRAILALETLAADHQAAVECLVLAARTGNEAMREDALDALRRAGPLGLTGLVALLPDSRAGDRAAVLLARTDPDAAVRPLLDFLAAEGATARPVVREALATAIVRADGDVDQPLLDWLQTEPPVTAVAAAALAIPDVAQYRPTLTRLIEYAIGAADDFETRWRLLRAASRAGASPSIDAWAQAQLDDAREWMIRQAAIETLAARGLRTRARSALADPYPRVRATAASALSKDPGSMTSRATLARRDTWPMVRAAAVNSLRSEPSATPVIVAAVDDPMSEVRTSAIEVLTHTRHQRGWERIHGRLSNQSEWPDVTAAAIDYVVVHCRSDAVDALVGVIGRAASPSALTEDINNAARAIVALRALGTKEADAAIQRLQSAGVPPTLKLALEQPLPRSRRCAPVPP